MHDLQCSFGGFARHCIEPFVDKRGDWIAAHNSLWLFSRGGSLTLAWKDGGNFKSVQTSKQRGTCQSCLPSIFRSIPSKVLTFGKTIAVQDFGYRLSWGMFVLVNQGRVSH